MQGAAFLGYKLISRTTEEVRVEVHGAVHVFDVLATLEFNSDRKRMSVIVRTPEDQLLLMCKGADSIILKRLATSEPGVQTAMHHLVSRATFLHCLSTAPWVHQLTYHFTRMSWRVE